MTLLSDTTYNRLAKNFDDARLVLLNEFNEFHNSESLVNLTKTKSKINTRWSVAASKNLSPFKFAALIIRGKQVLMTEIKPVEGTPYGYLDIQYDSEA